ncbi:MAG TPA: hypothetical protein VEJ18_16550, partial [Planctomycetota bacterium]|nr:hypothetical protein [Planctomycetota bacterium]
AGRLDRRSTASSKPLKVALAVAGSACGFIAVQTAFRLGRLACNRDALQPRAPTESCLVAGWRAATGSAGFLLKAVLGIGLWAAVFNYTRDVFR